MKLKLTYHFEKDKLLKAAYKLLLMHSPEIKRTQKTSIRLIMNQNRAAAEIRDTETMIVQASKWASKVKFRKLKTGCDNLFKTLPLLLTSNSICSQFAHSSSKVVCSVMSAILSAILDFWQPFMNRGLNSFHLPNTFRRFCDGFRTNEECSCLGGLPYHATFSNSIERDCVRIYSWISLYCVSSYVDQGRIF